jgi:hypothetical protein
MLGREEPLAWRCLAGRLQPQAQGRELARRGRLVEGTKALRRLLTEPDPRRGGRAVRPFRPSRDRKERTLRLGLCFCAWSARIRDVQRVESPVIQEVKGLSGLGRPEGVGLGEAPVERPEGLEPSTIGVRDGAPGDGFPERVRDDVPPSWRGTGATVPFFRGAASTESSTVHGWRLVSQKPRPCLKVN